MRIFYQEYEKMRFQLYKEDVLELLHRNPAFEDYSMEQLKQDLDSLIRWKNLTPIQDPGKVYTIADYNYANDPRYIGIRQFIQQGSIFNLNFLFDEPVGDWMPYDEYAFTHTKQKFIIGATNCLTGKQEFFEKHTYKELTEILAASSTLPVLSKTAYIDGIPYIDGGVSNAIPFTKAMQDGYKK